MRIAAVAVMMIVGLGAPAMAVAHSGRGAVNDLLQPIMTLTALGLGCAVYVRGARRRRGRWPRWRNFAAAGAAVTLAGALLSPLDQLSAEHLTAHMVQHTLLILVAAPLLALARPLAMLSSATSGMRWPRRLIVVPAAGIACLLHAIALWLWHLPGPYDLTLRSGLLHAAAHVSLFGTAVLLWTSVTRGRERVTGALWLFLTALHAGALGALLALSGKPWFEAHQSPGDQQLAGLVMWIPAGALLTLLALINLGNYFRARSRSLSPRLLALPIAAIALGALSGCDTQTTTMASAIAGRPSLGPDKLQKYGCVTCHTIPGVPGATATVGPSLAQLGRRSYVAGAPNTPDHLIRFIEHPRQTRPGTPMPEMGVSAVDAHDMAAYLYTLK